MGAHAIRQIGLADRARLRSAVDRFVGHDDPLADEWITGFVADHQSFAFVAVDAADDVLGWVWGTVHRRPDGPSSARIEALDVVETARRNGVGGLLFDAVFALAQQRRCGSIEAAVPVGLDDRARRFVASLGPSISDEKRVRWSL